MAKRCYSDFLCVALTPCRPLGVTVVCRVDSGLPQVQASEISPTSQGDRERAGGVRKQDKVHISCPE